MKKILPILFLPFIAGCCHLPNKDMIDPDAKWSLCYEKLDGDYAETWVDNSELTPVISRKSGAIELTYDKVGGRDISVKIVYSRSEDGKGLVITPSVKNNEENVFIRNFRGPVFERANDYDLTPLLYPRGIGLKIQAPPVAEGSEERPEKIADIWNYRKEDDCYVMDHTYPSSEMSMQWIAFAGKDEGLYISCIDGEFNPKKFTVRYLCQSGNTDYALDHIIACHTGEEHICPSMLIQKYKGDWHVAADMYRAWYDTVNEVIPHPQWVQESSGWLLAILKQQNQQIMWPYNTLGRELCDVADARGLDVIGMFGWAHGGHDHLYPDYIPDPLMGGREGVIQGIRELHERGKRAIIYSNGQLIDKGTEYWENIGRHIAIKDKSRRIILETWKKFSDYDAGTLGKACLDLDVWKQRLWDLAVQAHDIGADGILYDQLGNQTPYYCYSSEHGHPVPTLVLATDKLRILRDIRDRMLAIDPEFIVMTEGGIDPEMNSVAYFHSSIFGLLVPQLDVFRAAVLGKDLLSYCLFPEMIRYTFPEFLSTTRIPVPMNHPYEVNYTVLYGFRTEIESRYPGEVNFLLTDEVPEDSVFSNCLYYGGIKRHALKTDPVFARTYMKQAADLCRKHKDLLWSGKFNDNLGFTYSSENNGVIAKSFVNGDHMAVVLWNTDPEKDTRYSLDVPGYRLESIEAPEKEVKFGDKLDANRIHVAIFTK